MTIVNKKEPILVGLGDVIILILSLWVTLTVRYKELPTAELWQSHLAPFSVIFALSIVVFYIAGLYTQRHTVIVKNMLPGVIIKSQIGNAFLAVLLFYFVPAFTVTPKINLIVYLLIATCALIIWRLSVFPLMRLRKRQRALVIGTGPEFESLVREMNGAPRSSLESAAAIDLGAIQNGNMREALSDKMRENNISYVVLDLSHEKVVPLLPELYKTLFLNVGYIDIHVFYEEIFDRIPLSCMTYGWVLEHISPASTRLYDIAKRTVDIVLSLIVGIVALVLYPFVTVLIKLSDGGPVFITQTRVGKNGKLINILKYRSMKVSDGGKWVTEGDDRVTAVGRFLRKSRIDELPQAWSVLRGDMSLIGPRPDIQDLGEHLKEQIPYYRTRTIVKPGLSGWAQINQEKPPQSVEETRERLSYDLYYIKNRSVMLDFTIVLRTIKTLLSRVGM
jgi:exopolysaccharide biosynthesis polyprenyl glycosylphosphotransferase